MSGQNAVTNRAVYYLAALCSATQRALGFRIGVGYLGSEFADGKSICVSGTIRTVVGKTRGQYQTKRLLHPLAKSFFAREELLLAVHIHEKKRMNLSVAGLRV